LDGYEEHFGMPINEEEVDKMFKNIDIDGNGSIDYTEFVMATMNEKNLVTNEKLK
jgi:calcium-dependent protein kinase